MPEGLLDYQGAAEYLGTTPRHVEELWAQRRLTAVKVVDAFGSGTATLTTI